MAEQQRIHKKSTSRQTAVQRVEKPAQRSQPATEQENEQRELSASPMYHVGTNHIPPVSLESLMASRGLRLQPKLRVTAANDRYEQEADAVASQVVERLQAPPTPKKQAQRQEEEEEPLQAKPLAATISRVQRQEAQETEEEEVQAQRLQRQETEEAEEEELQAKRATPTPIGRDGGELDASTEQTLEAARGGGQRLPSDVREPMEQAFGADFGSVRLHTGGQAHHLNRAISAKAFTTGSDIFFRQGAYEPHNRSGQELLAHELAHVVQQGNAPARAYDVQRDDEDEPVPPPMPQGSERDEDASDGSDDSDAPAPTGRPRSNAIVGAPPMLDGSDRENDEDSSDGPAPTGRPRSNAVVGAPPMLDGSDREDEQEISSVEGSRTSTRSFRLQELSYDGLSLYLQQALGLSDPTAVASLGVNFTFNIGISAGISKILGAAITPYISLGGTINVGDDRRLRVGASLSFGAESELNLFQLWKVHAKIGMSLSIGATFEDEKHFAAFLISRIAALLKGFKRVVLGRAKERGKQLTAEEIKALQEIRVGGGDEGYEELSEKGVSVTARSVGLSSEVGTTLVGVGATFGASEKRTNFFKDNAEGKRVKKTGHTTTFTFSPSIPGLPFEIEVTRTIVSNDANPDNDGDYLNIKVAPTFSIGPGKLQQALLNAPTVFSGSSFKDGCERLVRAVADPANLLVFSGVGEPASAALEFNMSSRADASEGKSFEQQIEDEDYILQYARLTKNFKLGFSAEQEIPTGVPGLNVKLKESLSFERSVGAFEFLGSGTLSYIQTVYNGLLNRGRRGQRQWEVYRDQHRSEIYDMFIAVGDPSSAAAAEAKGVDPTVLSDEVLEQDKELRQKVRDARTFIAECEIEFNPTRMKDYDLEKEEDREDLRGRQAVLMPYFEAYLEVARQVGKAESAGTWRLVRSGSVTARVSHPVHPFRPELLDVKTDKGEEEQDPKFPVNLRESYEEGFRHHLTFIGHMLTGQEVPITVNFQKPDEPGEKFTKKVYSKGLHKFTKFPMGLTFLDKDFTKHWVAVDDQSRTRYESHVKDGMNEKKAKERSGKEVQQQWEKELYKHLNNVMEAALDNQLERQN